MVWCKEILKRNYNKEEFVECLRDIAIIWRKEKYRDVYGARNIGNYIYLKQYKNM
jgi:hypothetical protein